MLVRLRPEFQVSESWKRFAESTGVDLSKPFSVEHSGRYNGMFYTYKLWDLPHTAFDVIEEVADRPLEDYL